MADNSPGAWANTYSRAAASDLADLASLAEEVAPWPDRAAANLHKWLAATGSPETNLAALASAPWAARPLLTLFGSSQHLSDSLAQNPELASMFMEPGFLDRTASREEILVEGRALIASSSSPSHALDRARYLKQKAILRVAAADLCGVWEQEKVWRALSEVACGLINLLMETGNQNLDPNVAGRPAPVMVVAYGKLGGMELNYSSDVDLVFITEDGLDPETERAAARQCEWLIRSLSERMGRGALYRVDMRLRPFGSAGAITSSMRAAEAYYKLHAEVWEVQALMRSAPLTGPPELCRRWQDLVRTTCTSRRSSEFMLAEIVESRARSAEAADPEDFKRGRGGVRDVELLAQSLQLIFARSLAAEANSTCAALRALAATGHLDQGTSESLVEAYTFLRKLEHRVQMLDDRQTHRLPATEVDRFGLARMMDMESAQALGRELARRRAFIEAKTQELLAPAKENLRATLLSELGAEAETVRLWFDGLPESDAFYASLSENEGSLARVRRIASFAPALVPHMRESVETTEALLSGEIEELSEKDPFAQLYGSTLSAIGATYHRARLAELARYALESRGNLGIRLSRLADHLIRCLVGRMRADLSVIALGSFGLQETSPSSDFDVVLLVEDTAGHAGAEGQAQELLAAFAQLRRLDQTLSLDLRLRPEGGKGLLVRSYAGLSSYELDGMEMWERFALGQARIVVGSTEALELVLRCAYSAPLTPERLSELVQMKRRIETERVLPQHLWRNVKLGHGSLSDIEWLVHLLEMRYPTASRAAEAGTLEERLRRLARANLINTLEADALVDARAHLSKVRAWVWLLGYEVDVLPENPDKLDRLARSIALADGNSLLSHHTGVTQRVRTMFSETLERLRA